MSIRQPWAWMVLHAGVDVESKNWLSKKSDYRGRVLVYAPKGMTSYQYLHIKRLAIGIDRRLEPIFPSYTSLDRGGVVGAVDIVRLAERPASKWHLNGRYGYELANPTPCTLYRIKGCPALWDVDRSQLQGLDLNALGFDTD